MACRIPKTGPRPGIGWADMRPWNRAAQSSRHSTRCTRDMRHRSSGTCPAGSCRRDPSWTAHTRSNTVLRRSLPFRMGTGRCSRPTPPSKWVACSGARPDRQPRPWLRTHRLPTCRPRRHQQRSHHRRCGAMGSSSTRRQQPTGQGKVRGAWSRIALLARPDYSTASSAASCHPSAAASDASVIASGPPPASSEQPEQTHGSKTPSWHGCTPAQEPQKQVWEQTAQQQSPHPPPQRFPQQPPPPLLPPLSPPLPSSASAWLASTWLASTPASAIFSPLRPWPHAMATSMSAISDRRRTTPEAYTRAVPTPPHARHESQEPTSTEGPGPRAPQSAVHRGGWRRAGRGCRRGRSWRARVEPGGRGRGGRDSPCSRLTAMTNACDRWHHRRHDGPHRHLAPDRSRRRRAVSR